MNRVVILGLYFMMYALLGWCWETPFASFVEEKKFVNRGFLHGPFIPIYAFGIGFIVTFVDWIAPYLSENIVLYYGSMWLITALICSILEYVVSYGLELIFDTRWWDYSDHKYNLNGRVSLLYSIGWGIGGCIVYSVIHPNVTQLIYSIPMVYRGNIFVAFLTYFTIDFSLTLKELISLKKIMLELNNITDELKGMVVYNIDFIKSGFGNTVDKITENIDLGQEKLLDTVEKTHFKIKSEFITLKAKSGINLSLNQKELIRKYNIKLENTKALSRFYKNYPRAKSNLFGGSIEIVKNRFKRKDD